MTARKGLRISRAELVLLGGYPWVARWEEYSQTTINCWEHGSKRWWLYGVLWDAFLRSVLLRGAAFHPCDWQQLLQLEELAEVMYDFFGGGLLSCVGGASFIDHTRLTLASRGLKIKIRNQGKRVEAYSMQSARLRLGNEAARLRAELKIIKLSAKSTLSLLFSSEKCSEQEK